MEAQKKAIAAVEAEFGGEYPLIIDGNKIMMDSKHDSVDPADHATVIGSVSKAGAAEAELAVEKAYEAFQWWRRWTPGARARILSRAAEVLKRRRFEFNAWMVFEEGKNWIEADADTAEAIDFLNFYAREALRYLCEPVALPLKNRRHPLSLL